MLNSGSHPVVAVYMTEKMLGPTWLSLPGSIHTRGIWPAVFAETVAVFVVVVEPWRLEP